MRPYTSCPYIITSDVNPEKNDKILELHRNRQKACFRFISKNLWHEHYLSYPFCSLSFFSLFLSLAVYFWALRRVGWSPYEYGILFLNASLNTHQNLIFLWRKSLISLRIFFLYGFQRRANFSSENFRCRRKISISFRSISEFNIHEIIFTSFSLVLISMLMSIWLSNFHSTNIFLYA